MTGLIKTLVPESGGRHGLSYLFTHPGSLGRVDLIARYDPASGELSGLEVAHADPEILISGHFLRDLAAGRVFPRVPRARCDRAELGGLLRIEADNRTLIYVLTETAPELDGLRVPDSFRGRWPD